MRLRDLHDLGVDLNKPSPLSILDHDGLVLFLALKYNLVSFVQKKIYIYIYIRTMECQELNLNLSLHVKDLYIPQLYSQGSQNEHTPNAHCLINVIINVLYRELTFIQPLNQQWMSLHKCHEPKADYVYGDIKLFIHIHTHNQMAPYSFLDKVKFETIELSVK